METMIRKSTVVEIIGIGNNAVYSIGKIQITKQGDVYLIPKIKDIGAHFSRHKDGNCHVRMKGKELFNEFEKRVPISDFDGFEFLETWAFGLDSLPELYSEYKPNKCNAVVAINMRHFKESRFNLGIAILTEKGMSYLMSMWEDFNNRQVYICASTTPMVGIVFGARKTEFENT
ncbi:MAG: hypothetical protein Q8K00_19085 [Syntrophales bacterium]|nr:hypothetical protein [Syntrophales bacterium]